MKVAVFSPEYTRLSIDTAIKLIVIRKDTNHQFWSTIPGFDGSVPETKKQIKLTKVRLMLLDFFNDENICPIKINEPTAIRHYDGDVGQDEEFDISVEEFKLFACLFDLEVSNGGNELSLLVGMEGASREIRSVRCSSGTPMLSPSGEEIEQPWGDEIEEALMTQLEQRIGRLKKQIPGKLPRQSIRKLAVKIAWEIEVDTRKRAACKTVMACLCELAAKDNDKDCLLYADTSIPGQEQVKWSTDEGIEAWFSLDDCKSALTTWRKSLPQK